MTLTLTDSSVLSGIGPWLPAVDAILKSTILLALTAASSLLFRRASAATRHAIWTLGLAGALVLPALSFALPRWEMALVTVESAAGPVAGDQGLAIMGPSPSSRAPELQGPRTEGPRTEGPLTQGPVTRDQGPGTPRSWQSIVLTIWIAGAIAVLARLFLGLIAVQWMSRRIERVTGAPWLDLARELAASMGVGSNLTFLRSRSATMPMAWGILQRSILMPADADSWPIERLRIVLLHELAHVKRRDCLTHALAQIACAVYWFNPLSWIAVRQMRTERERACDDLVLAAGTRGSDYAAELLEVARVMRSGQFPALLAGATLAMAHRSQLEGRLIAILDPRVPRSGLSRVRTGGATALVACALVPFASLQPWAYAQRPPVPEPQQMQNPQPPATPQRIQNPQPRPAPVVQRPIPSGGAGERAAESTVQRAVENASETVQTALQSVVQGTVQGVVQGVTAGVTSSIGAVTGESTQSKADPRTVAALTSALKDSDVEVREAAMHALIQLRDPSIFEPLVQALKDASADVRQNAAHGLAQLRDARAIEPLTAALKDEHPSVREQVVFALGQLRAQNSVPALILALKDENASVRGQAAFALSQLRDRRAVPALTAAMTDTSEEVREQAVFALGQLRDPSAVDALIIALRDSKGDIRENAVFALGQIRDPRAVPPLIAALKDPDPEVRQNAAFALSQIRDRSAVEALAIATKDSNAEVRGQAVFALGQLRDPRAIDALTAALKDSSAEVRQQAAFALGQIR